MGRARVNPRTRFAPAQVDAWDSVTSVSATCVAQLKIYLLQSRSVEAAANALGEGEMCRPLAVWLCSHFFNGMVFCFEVRMRASERGSGRLLFRHVRTCAVFVVPTPLLDSLSLSSS